MENKTNWTTDGMRSQSNKFFLFILVCFHKLAEVKLTCNSFTQKDYVHYNSHQKYFMSLPSNKNLRHTSIERCNKLFEVRK